MEMLWDELQMEGGMRLSATGKRILNQNFGNICYIVSFYLADRAIKSAHASLSMYQIYLLQCNRLANSPLQKCSILFVNLPPP